MRSYRDWDKFDVDAALEAVDADEPHVEEITEFTKEKLRETAAENDKIKLQKRRLRNIWRTNEDDVLSKIRTKWKRLLELVDASTTITEGETCELPSSVRNEEHRESKEICSAVTGIERVIDQRRLVQGQVEAGDWSSAQDLVAEGLGQVLALEKRILAASVGDNESMGGEVNKNLIEGLQKSLLNLKSYLYFHKYEVNRKFDYFADCLEALTEVIASRQKIRSIEEERKKREEAARVELEAKSKIVQTPSAKAEGAHDHVHSHHDKANDVEIDLTMELAWVERGRVFRAIGVPTLAELQWRQIVDKSVAEGMKAERTAIMRDIYAGEGQLGKQGSTVDTSALAKLRSILEWKRQGDKIMEEGFYLSAIHKYQSALDAIDAFLRDPQPIGKENEDTARTLQKMEEVFKSSISASTCHLNIAQSLLLLQKDHKQVLEHCGSVLEVMTEREYTSRAYLLRGKAFLAMNEEDKALTELKCGLQAVGDGEGGLQKELHKELARCRSTLDYL